MQNSKALRLLATFSNKEWAGFTDFLLSPFLNKRQELIPLSKILAASAPDFEDLDKGQLWSSVYPKKDIDDKQLNYLLSWLQDAAVRFLVATRMEKQPLEQDMTATNLLSERNLDKHFEFQINRIRRLSNEETVRDARYWYREFRLVDQERTHFTRKETRRSNPFLQKGADCLDRYYFSEKLRYACGMMNDQGIIASDFEFLFVEEIRNFLQQQPALLAEPSIAVYYHIWQLLTQTTDGEIHFQALKTLINTYSKHFSPEECRELYGYALNFCIGQIRNVQKTYVGEALSLYEEGIESGILLQDAMLSPWHYKNIVKLGLRSGRFDWTEQFILEKNKLLETSFREDALHFNLADLYFFTGKYEQALTHLQQVEFSDIHYNLGAKEMLAKIYYETDADDALFSLIHAFRNYLRRNKVISEQIRKAYLNFLKLLEQSFGTSPDRIPELRTKIEQTEPLVARNWLLERCV